MSVINLVFPHQLFADSPLLEQDHPFYLVEAFLFFKQYPFHQQKLAFHRASMKCYERYLQDKKREVHYVEAMEKRADVRQLIKQLGQQGITEIHCIDPTDDWLNKRIRRYSAAQDIKVTFYDSPLFLNTTAELESFFKPTKKKFFQTSFYTAQRKQRKILVDDEDKPIGGKWSFDAENRKKYPKKKTPPPMAGIAPNDYHQEAKAYVQKNFASNPGKLDHYPIYPTDFEETQKWLELFLEQRFHDFGTYEDAIVAEHSFLNHSVLTPMLNVGLLLPQQILDRALSFAENNNIPINSTEGFIRQIIGWREFIRGVYLCKGVEERTKNFWGFKRKIPKSWYDGTTGIYPIDVTIKKILQTGYCHHIERLMVLGNFMVLCEFDPDEVYRWFMELFIDAYDWVMVPNVYGMSQFADGGLMSTKPYISGSNYLKKMSNYPKGDWQETWDALFWRFMHVHRDFFLKNPRLGMLVRSFDKMDSNKQKHLIDTAEQYLKGMDEG